MDEFIVTFVVRIGENEPTHYVYRVLAQTIRIAFDNALEAHQKALEQIHEPYASRFLSCVAQSSTHKATEH